MSLACVLDCSLAMSWCFADERTPETVEILRLVTRRGAIIPGHWRLEVANVLAIAEQRKRLTPAKSGEFIDMLSTLDLHLDREAEAARHAFSELLPLCRAYGLTSYDAGYLELARRSRLPLASLDDELRAAAKKLGIKTLGR